jgi:hypothetical protein
LNSLNSDKTWQIQDATKINSFMECPRSYFYEYVLGWRSEVPNLHLEFGSAWHLAMAHLLTQGYAEQSVIEAYVLFEQHYRKYFPDIMDEVNAPKNPGNALRALLQYVKEYAGDKQVVHYTEIAGTVPIDDKHLLHFKMDSILEVEGQMRSREHKTGSTLSRQWEDQWSLAMQTGVYNHVLCCIYPPEQVWGVEINGVFFQKKENKFKRVPARRGTDMMNVWMWNTLHQLHMIDFEFERLADCKDEDRVLEAFPLNPTNCTKYFGCRYHDFCMVWANPLQHCYEVPFGYKVEYWNPADAEKTAKKVFTLEGREV